MLIEIPKVLMNDNQCVGSFSFTGRQVLLFLTHRNVCNSELFINSFRKIKIPALSEIKRLWVNEPQPITLNDGIDANQIPVKWILQAHSFSSSIQLSSTSNFGFPYSIDFSFRHLARVFSVSFSCYCCWCLFFDLVCFCCARAFLNLQHFFFVLILFAAGSYS